MIFLLFYNLFNYDTDSKPKHFTVSFSINWLCSPFHLNHIYHFIGHLYQVKILQSSYVNYSLQQELHYVSLFNCYFDYRDNKPFHFCYTVYHWNYFNNFTTQSYLSFEMITKLLLTLHSNSILLQLANFRNANWHDNTISLAPVSKFKKYTHMLTNLHFKPCGFIENLFIHLTWLQSNIYCFFSQSIQLVLPEYNSKITVSHIQVFQFQN